jgi:hypothetical protein
MSFVALATLSLLQGHASAQMIGVTTPGQSLGSGFSESFGTSGSVRGPNWFMNNNLQVVPPFGPSIANTGTRGGFGFGGNGVSGNLGFHFAQGSDRSIVSSAPSVTLMDGQPGGIVSGQTRPFVMGVSPVVGAYQSMTGELAAVAAADRHAKLSAIAMGNAERQNDRLRALLVRAERAESEGDWKMARANYKLAVPMAPEPMKSMIRAKLRSGAASAR